MIDVENLLTHEQAELLANKIRKTYWDENKFPVDPVTIGRALSIRIVDVQLPENVAGALLKKIGEDPVIMLHADDPVNRKRFTLAHELGHYIYRMERGHFDDQEIDHVDHRNQDSRKGSDVEEISANRFAASLLMPQDQVKLLCKSTVDVFELSKFFEVSTSAMKYRLNTLEIKCP
ncbi:MAG: ImmA/IrrE family metallo-endopeptidase [Saccharospirillaceae bacterium]|nr:ImmA/IrrE family metallo-endopeptidase [Pseudomonadales bacterium]NRB78492.1 ImmA/IrrE family metallo-endopeptidase [Saccharospirillaceae bacterium]